MKQIGLRWPEELVERVDAVLPDGVSRSEFIRRCVLVALETRKPLGDIGEPAPSIQESTEAYERATKKRIPTVPGVVRAADFEGCGHQITERQGDRKVCLNCGASRDLNSFSWRVD